MTLPMEESRMRKLVRRALSGAAVAVTVLSLAAPTMSAAPAGEKAAGSNALRSDNHKGPFTDRQNARRKAAQELILSGKASPNEDGVVQLADDKYYEAALTGTGRVFTILSEFGSAAK